MAGLAAAERDLGRQPRGARQQRSHRRPFVAFGEEPVTVERKPGLLDDAHALGHHHQGGWRRDDAGDREREGLARQVRLGQRQEAAQTVVEDEHGVLAVHLDAAIPVVDLAPQAAGPCELDQATLIHAAPQREQRRIEARCAARTAGRSGTRSRACGSAVTRRWAVPLPSSPAGCRAAPRAACGAWRPGRASGWRRPRSGKLPRGRSARPAGAVRPCGCAAGRQRSAPPRPAARERRRGRRRCRGRGRRGRSRRSPAPTARGRAGTGARRDGSARLHRRIRRGPTPARAAAAAWASETEPGRGPAARRRGSAPAARRQPGQRRPRRAIAAATEARSRRAFIAARAARRGGGGRTVRGVDPAVRWRRRRTGSRSRTW